MKKPLILVDADQTSFKYLELFCPDHNSKHGTDWDVDKIHVYDLTAAFGLSSDVLNERFSAFNKIHLASLPAVDGAPEGVRALREMGYDIACASDRPVDLQQDTEACYRRGFGGDVCQVYLTGQACEAATGRPVTKGTLCRDLGAVAMVEDSLERAREIRQTSPRTTVYLFKNYRWNQCASPGEGIIRTVTWEDVVREARKLRATLGD